MSPFDPMRTGNILLHTRSLTLLELTGMDDVLRREIKVLTFDQYGTIVDMQQGLTEAITPFLKRKGWDGKPNNFVTWCRRCARETPVQGIQADNPIERRPRHAESRSAAHRLSIRSRHFGTGGRLFQAALENLCESRGDHRQ